MSASHTRHINTNGGYKNFEIFNKNINECASMFDNYYHNKMVEKKLIPSSEEEKALLKKEELDFCVFHQANKFMLKSLQQLCGLEKIPYWNDVAEYGKTVTLYAQWEPSNEVYYEVNHYHRNITTGEYDLYETDQNSSE